MNECKIKYGIKDGVHFIELIHPDDISEAYASRRITGTHSEEGHGIFNNLGRSYEDVKFYYGDYSKIFSVPPISVPDYQYAMRELVSEIRAWIREIDFEDEMTFYMEED